MKILQDSILSSTKNQEFFENISPLEKTPFEASPTPITNKLENELKAHRKKLLGLTSIEGFVNNDLATIRLLVNEIKELLELLVPKTVAEFHCSFSKVGNKMAKNKFEILDEEILNFIQATVRKNPKFVLNDDDDGFY